MNAKNQNDFTNLMKFCLIHSSISKENRTIIELNALRYVFCSQDYASRILSGILSLIGDDFESEVNFHALRGLRGIIPLLSPKLVKTRVSDIVNKIFPFFDGGRKRRDGAMAIRCVKQTVLRLHYSRANTPESLQPLCGFSG